MHPALFVTIGVMVFVVAVSAGLWARRPGARPIIGGVGGLLALAGVQLLGLMDLLYNGVMSLVDWVARTAWSTTMSWGAGLLAGGLVLLVVARFLKSAPLAADKPSPKVKAAPAQRPPAPVTTGAKPPTAAVQSPKPGVDAEDAEIEALLRKRGIM